MPVGTVDWQGWPAIVLEDAQTRVVFVPDLGGKMVSLVRRESGRDFLLHPPGGRRYRRVEYGASFGAFDTSGFDECLPTIAADGDLPDHGELWSRPWASRMLDDGGVELTVDGVRRPYRFTRAAHLVDGDLHLDYTLQNLGEQAFPYLWSAHPLLAVDPGDKILLPDEVTRCFIDSSADDRLGQHGDSCLWPMARQQDGQTDDLDVVKDRDSGFADKLYTNRLASGYASLYRAASQESLTFRFDVRTTPFLGLWICQGGWPADETPGHLTVALEPCNGRPDALSAAIERSECPTIEAGATHRWAMQLEPRAGYPVPDFPTEVMI